MPPEDLRFASAARGIDVAASTDRHPPIQQNLRQQGSWLLHQLQEMATKHPDVVAAARGSGLLTGLVLKCAVGPVVSACREAGLLTVPAAGDVLRLLPPLNVTRQELSEGLQILEKFPP